MTNQTKKDLQQIEKLVVKLRNKMRRADIDYTVQISINSTDPQTVTYASQLTSPAKGLAPVTFIASSADELMTKIKVATENIDYKSIEIAYHKAQIDSCERTKLGHEERIAEIEAEEDSLEDIESEEANKATDSKSNEK